MYQDRKNKLSKNKLKLSFPRDLRYSTKSQKTTKQQVQNRGNRTVLQDIVQFLCVWSKQKNMLSSTQTQKITICTPFLRKFFKNVLFSEALNQNLRVVLKEMGRLQSERISVLPLLSQFNLPNQTPSWILGWLLESETLRKPGGTAFGVRLQLCLFLGTWHKLVPPQSPPTINMDSCHDP